MKKPTPPSTERSSHTIADVDFTDPRIRKQISDVFQILREARAVRLAAESGTQAVLLAKNPPDGSQP